MGRDGAKGTFTIAHLSDIHCGDPNFVPSLMDRAIAEINELEPDIVICSGDLTTFGFKGEYLQAREYLDKLNSERLVVIPGNHDSRNVGYIHFEELFGERHSVLHVEGVSVVAVDSSEPDLDNGQIGRGRYSWIEEQFAVPASMRIFVMHHHLLPVPGTGRERNIVLDAADLLLTLIEQDVDLVLSGHKHVPFFWGLNGMLICNSGTAGTRRIRASTPPSWNELRIDATTVKVFTHYVDGRRELSAIFSRKTRALTREAFFVTDAFRGSNRASPD